MKPEEIIVDLYECRARMVKPYGAGETGDLQRILHDTHEFFQYNWLNVIIAQLSDKYKVKHRDIEEEIRKRSSIIISKEL